MGLAASQARLLFVTARKSDVEFSEMKCATNKMALARDSREISDDYNRSLNMRKLTFEIGSDPTSGHTVDLTYDLLMTPNATNVTNQYLLTDNNNRVVLSEGFTSKLGLGNSGVAGDLAAAYPNKVDFLRKLVPEITESEGNGYIAKHVDTVDGSLSPVAAKTIDSVMNTIFYSANGIGEGNFAATKASTVTNQVFATLNTAFTDLEKMLTEQKRLSDLSAQKSGKPATTDPAITNMIRDLAVAKSLLSTAHSSGDVGQRTACIVALKTILTGAKVNDLIPDQDSDTRSTWEKTYIWHSTPNDEWNRARGTESMLQQQLGANGYQNADTVYTGNLYDTYTVWTDPNTGGAGAAGGAGGTSTTSNQTQADFYLNLYQAINAKGWSTNTNITNSKYLSNEIINGNLQLQRLNSNGTWSQSALSDPSSPIRNERDTEGMEIAKSKYDMARDAINDKDTQIDMEMKNLETERSALDTEMDSVKAIITKNIERTFKTFA